MVGLRLFIVIIAVYTGAVNAELNSDILYFLESEVGVDPYATRFIINTDYIRIDSGEDMGDYVLFDQNKNIIYNVSHMDRSVLEVKYKSGKLRSVVQKKLDLLELSIKEKGNGDLPRIAGKSPSTYLLLAQNQICAEVSAVDGLLDDALKSLMKYQQLLISNNKFNLRHMPIEYVKNCMLANDIKGATRYLQFGFPIFWQKENGYRRFLTDFKENQSVHPNLFTLPEEYERYSPLS